MIHTIISVRLLKAQILVAVVEYRFANDVRCERRIYHVARVDSNRVLQVVLAHDVGQDWRQRQRERFILANNNVVITCTGGAFR